MCMQEKDIDVKDFTENLQNWTGRIENTVSTGIGNLRHWITLDMEETAIHISRHGLDPRFDDGWDGISPFVVGSVIWSLYSFLRTPSDYIQTVATAIAVGGDVDTTAAMAGAISGTYLGINAIPEKMSKQLTDQGTWGLVDLRTLMKECYNLKLIQKNKPKLDSKIFKES